MKDIPFPSQEGISSIPPTLLSWDIRGMEGALEQDGKLSLDRLRTLILSDGRTERAISLAIGANASYVAQLFSGKGGQPSAQKLRRLAEELNTTTDFLVGRSDAPGQIRSEVSLAEMPQGWRGPKRDGIPVHGTGLCGDLIITGPDGSVQEIEQLQLDVDHAVDWIERPRALAFANDAYAIYFHGSSMERRFYQGERGIVDPVRPARPGDIVLVQISDGETGSMVCALVKELVRSTSSFVELLQYNPEIRFRLPQDRVMRMHRVYRPDELLGT